MPATADLTVNSPPITDLRITKTPDLQTVDSGQTASFTISLRNEGETTITSLSVDDPLTPDCDRTSGIPDLPPVDSFSYTCQTDPLIGGFVNLATVTGLVGETPIEGSDTAQVNVVTPEIGITKTPDTQSVNPGEKATFTIKIVNNSSSTLTSISVEDPLTSSCERLAGTLADLAPGEMLDYTCEAEDLFADLTNVATASADGVDPVSDSVSVDVIAPVEISKDPAEQQVVSGEKATFTITITNPGAGTLTDVTVFDPSTPDCDRMIGTLGPGTSVDYPCETPELLSDLLNEATVTAQDPRRGYGQRFRQRRRRSRQRRHRGYKRDFDTRSLTGRECHVYDYYQQHRHRSSLQHLGRRPLDARLRPGGGRISQSGPGRIDILRLRHGTALCDSDQCGDGVG